MKPMRHCLPILLDKEAAGSTIAGMTDYFLRSWKRFRQEISDTMRIEYVLKI